MVRLRIKFRNKYIWQLILLPLAGLLIFANQSVKSNRLNIVPTAVPVVVSTSDIPNTILPRNEEANNKLPSDPSPTPAVLTLGATTISKSKTTKLPNPAPQL